jgi:aminocarboxymuconate-semialdehyde decarboxylase
MVVDHQAHWFPQSYLDQICDREEGRYPRAERTSSGGYAFWPDPEPLGSRWEMGPDFFDLDLQLKDMDAAGVDVAVLAPTMFGDLSRGDLGEAKETLQLLNEESARIVSEHPDRCLSLAMLPMQDVDAALEALEDAIGRLGLHGVSMVGQVNDEPLVSEERFPIFERIEQLGVPIVLHPADRSLVSEQLLSLGTPPEVGVSWMFETSIAALSFVTTGLLDRCPGLNVVHPHLGGVLPYLKARFDAVQVRFPLGERGLNEYLRHNFYADTMNLSPGALEMAIGMYGLDQIVFATDYPWIPREKANAMMNGIDPEVAERIKSNRVPGLKLPTRSVNRSLD